MIAIDHLLLVPKNHQNLLDSLGCAQCLTTRTIFQVLRLQEIVCSIAKDFDQGQEGFDKVPSPFSTKDRLTADVGLLFRAQATLVSMAHQLASASPCSHERRWLAVAPNLGSSSITGASDFRRFVIPVVVAAMAVVKVPFVMAFLVVCLRVPLWAIEN